MRTFRHRYLLALSAAALLGACASTPPEASVQVFTAPPRIAPGTTYRHDRLPSQAAQPYQASLEAAADAAMSRAGLRRDEAGARLALQLTARQTQVNSGWGWGGPSVGVGLGTGSGGGFGGVGLSFPIGGGGVARASQLVDVQLRDTSTGQVVFQSQASGSDATSPAALVQAALADFPNAPPGARQLPLQPAAPR